MDPTYAHFYILKSWEIVWLEIFFLNHQTYAFLLQFLKTN